MPVIKEASLTEAEKALHAAYRGVLDVFAKKLRDTPLAYTRHDEMLLSLSEMPIVHIMPQGRRVESGWYRPGVWEKSSSKTALAMGAESEKAKYDEVFIAGEALSWSRRQIVDLLVHQAVHQSVRIASQTYHPYEFRRAAERMGLWMGDRDPVHGYKNLDIPDKLAKKLDKIADAIDPSALDVYRLSEGVQVGSGKMKKWVCQCRYGPKVYTGAVLQAVCESCGSQFMYAHKDREGMAEKSIYLRVKLLRRNVPVLPWFCSTCERTVPSDEPHGGHDAVGR